MFLWPDLWDVFSCSNLCNHSLKSVLKRGLTDVQGNDKETWGEAPC